ncbi:DNA-binding response regulator [Pedobacter yulinensis]|uniref:DNA-binding response regulator n=1 Tax=Pedobacter yulinensis TaxID=2126353 RepID=A0A2T3HL14_9SPHI|nr:LytTR family DNA-binding domain-containing protein [Pedobacter yulinensis]PST83145.1 DNA-binding response regulator [Pedobacter yulinensis]
MKLSCLIVDDEPNAVALLRVLILENTDWEISACCYDAREALDFLRNNTADLIFLDINMPRLSGMELAALLPGTTRLVFTTAYSEFAAASYGFNTLDYLLKPITLGRFLAARGKIERAFEPPATTTDLAPAAPRPDWFFVKSGKTINRISLNDLLYIEGEKEYLRLVTTGGDLLVYKRMKEMAEQLTLPFFRVHNSWIVNTERITRIQDNQIYIGGKRIPVSDKFRGAFFEIITKGLL